jgi:IstB-like ATP binding protein
VERANGYFETSFLPGRTFTDYLDFDRQLTDWLAMANTRRHRAIGCRPAERIETDRAGMLAPPPLAPMPALTGWSLTTRLPRDHYVRLASNDYSVHPSAVGRLVHVTADLHTIRVFCDGPTGQLAVGEHESCWARHQTITDPAHRAAADQMRAAHRAHTKAPASPVPTPGRSVEVLSRPLTHYDVVLVNASLSADAGAGRQIDLTAFSRWGDIFADEVVAAAIIDRLVHHADVIALNGDSYRLAHRRPSRTRTPNQP